MGPESRYFGVMLVDIWGHARGSGFQYVGLGSLQGAGGSGPLEWMSGHV